MTALVPGLSYLERPLWVVAAIVVPVLMVALLAYREHDRRRRLARLGDPATVARLLPRGPTLAAGRRMYLLGGAAVCGSIALAGPRWGTERTAVRTTGADVAVAVDASLSMLATDERPNRLERAKEDVRRLRALAPGDRTALIAFAGRSYILSPLTIDDGALALFLDNLDPAVVGQPGTAISRAIRQGTDLLLATQTASDRALIILSDGEDFEPEEDVRAAATHAAESGISLITVGYGTGQGSTIPVPVGDHTESKRDETGAVVVTRYAPELLRTAAEAAGGTFIPATATDKAANIRRALAKLRVVRRAVEQDDDRSPKFQLFLFPALVLLVVDTLLADRRRPWRRAGTHRRGRLATLPSPLGAAMAIALILPVPPSREGDPAAQAAALRRAVERGDRSPQTLYNYGTALLAADSSESAIAALTRVADARDADVRYRAWFNLGLAHLKRGLAAGAGESATSELDAAIDAYKRVLLTRPTDQDARWNFELALRQRQGGGRGGTGGDGRGGGGGGGGAGQSPSPPAARSAAAMPSALGHRQAEELLNSAAREERDVQGRVQRQNPADVPPGGKDW
jgi:Ca-activated chloride channel family protein